MVNRYWLGTVLAVLGVVAAGPQAVAQAPGTPVGFNASLGTASGGIQLQWTPVQSATFYEIGIYANLFTSTRVATVSTVSANGLYLDFAPCGVYRYYELIAKNGVESSGPTPRILGYTASCADGVQSCEYTAVPLTGAGSVTFSTEGSANNYRIGDRLTPCEDGNDPGTAGTGPDMVFTYLSGYDCTLTLTLAPEGAFESILYISDTCEAYACDYYSNVFEGVDTLTVPVVKDAPIYIFVDGYNNLEGMSAGTFTLTLETADCAAPATCAEENYGFDDGALPAGWSAADRDGGGPAASGRYAFGAWGVIEDLSGSAYNHVAAAYAPANGIGTTDDWLIAGPFNVDQGSAVTWRDAQLGSGDMELGLYIASTPDPEAFIFEGNVFSVVAVDITETMTTRTVPLDGVAAAAGAVYLGFRHRGVKSGFFLLDDIGVCGLADSFHTSDQNSNGAISLSELLRVIQFYNSLRLHCQDGTEDGFAPGPGDESCTPHQSDYAPADWVVSLSELLRLIQFYNTGGYISCPGSEDGFCPAAGS